MANNSPLLDPDSLQQLQAFYRQPGKKLQEEERRTKSCIGWLPVYHVGNDFGQYQQLCQLGQSTKTITKWLYLLNTLSRPSIIILIGAAIFFFGPSLHVTHYVGLQYNSLYGRCMQTLKFSCSSIPQLQQYRNMWHVL